jgi:hypothetical protein
MEHTQRRLHSQLGAGIFLLIIGIILLLDNFNILDVGSVWKFWPAIIIAIGLWKLLDAQVAREYQKAFSMLFIGSWLFISELHIFGLSYGNSWPILLIGIGISMLWKSFYSDHLRIAKDHCHGN